MQGWFRLWFSFDDDQELDREAEFLPELQEFAQRFAGSNVEVRWPRLNGSYFLTITGYTNRPRTDSDDLHALLTMVSERLPESYGMLYELDDEGVEEPGRNAWRVRVMTRGELRWRTDPFLSPIMPVIESPEDWWVRDQSGIEGLRGIDVRGSRVVAVQCSPGRLELVVDFALAVGHPAYAESGGRRMGKLWLVGVRDLYWTEQGGVGDLEEVVLDGEMCRIRGEFGTITAVAQHFGVEA